MGLVQDDAILFGKLSRAPVEGSMIVRGLIWKAEDKIPIVVEPSQSDPNPAVTAILEAEMNEKIGLWC